MQDGQMGTLPQSENINGHVQRKRRLTVNIGALHLCRNIPLISGGRKRFLRGRTAVLVADSPDGSRNPHQEQHTFAED